MGDRVGVVIGTYGDRDTWEPLVERARLSVAAQTVDPAILIHNHAVTLREARNYGAVDCEAHVDGGVDWLIFLDADDELDPGYIEAMLAGTGDIRRPATQGIHEDGTIEEPAMIPEPSLGLRVRNYIVVGAMCRADLFFQIGGFDDYEMLEDWALWRRMVAAGATVGDVPDAIYRIHVRPESRNAAGNPDGGRIYRQIIDECPL